MSDLMLHGVLRMPPNLWRDDAIDVGQRHARYLQASNRIYELEATIRRLHEDAAIALASHRKDVIEECAKVCETVRAAHPDYATPHYYHGTEECAAAIRALKEREAG